MPNWYKFKNKRAGKYLLHYPLDKQQRRSLFRLRTGKARKHYAGSLSSPLIIYFLFGPKGKIRNVILFFISTASNTRYTHHNISQARFNIFRIKKKKKSITISSTLETIKAKNLPLKSWQFNWGGRQVSIQELAATHFSRSALSFVVPRSFVRSFKLRLSSSQHTALYFPFK